MRPDLMKPDLMKPDLILAGAGLAVAALGVADRGGDLVLDTFQHHFCGAAGVAREVGELFVVDLGVVCG